MVLKVLLKSVTAIRFNLVIRDHYNDITDKSSNKNSYNKDERKEEMKLINSTATCGLYYELQHRANALELHRSTISGRCINKMRETSQRGRKPKSAKGSVFLSFSFRESALSKKNFPV